ncbi:hypothetical protein GMOD_00006775 [Pyrenophora seminiperda CCB06]|uniref:Uncharacterized protein n=1 Tax=Pyrenophora seminiperda CCB06 TaxID=1302712 RepID=A0A3M7MAX7_9PLEO|nr:hypothetical protein GMOD_00006775 [Pyrenophora seminiperda CCB06]
MDHYPEVSVDERECPESRISSRHDSVSSLNKRQSTAETQGQHAPPRALSYHSFPSPSSHMSDNASSRSNSSSSTSPNTQRIEAQYARYTDAPPPYSAEQYKGKSPDEQNDMRMKDYAKEVSRMMTRQLVRGLKIDEREKVKKQRTK